MIDKKMINRKIVDIQKELLFLKEFKSFTFDEVAKDYKTHTIIERIIERIVNFAIDINQHFIVENGKGTLPFDFKESFLLLADMGVYPKEFGEKIGDSVGLRNILLHEYRKLDEQLFYNSIKDCFTDYTKYCRYILEYLSNIS